MVDERQLKIIGTGAVAVGVGGATGELLSETAARYAAQTGWYKVGLKAAIKGGVLLAFYGLSTKLSGLWSLGAEIAGYASAGSIFNDVFYELYPGGIWGMATNIAMSLRGFSPQRVQRGITRVERQPSGVGAVAPSQGWLQ